jgi:hypothetical protein
VRPCGVVSVPGVYGGPVTVNMGQIVQKGLTLRSGQTHVKRYLEPLTKLIQEKRVDTTFLITHRSTNLEDGPGLYKTFKEGRLREGRVPPGRIAHDGLDDDASRPRPCFGDVVRAPGMACFCLGTEQDPGKLSFVICRMGCCVCVNPARRPRSLGDEDQTVYLVLDDLGQNGIGRKPKVE